MSILERFAVRAVVDHGELRFCQVQEKDGGPYCYLLGEPLAAPSMQPHHGIGELRPLGEEDGRRWSVGALPPDLTLAQRWTTGGLTNEEQVHGFLTLTEALAHLIRTKPALLPSLLDPACIYLSGSGTWTVDLCSLAFMPEARFGSGSGVTQALGGLLDDLHESGRLCPTLHFVMMRCGGGGFSSLAEMQETVRRIESRRHETRQVESPPAARGKAPSRIEFRTALPAPTHAGRGSDWPLRRAVIVGGSMAIVLLMGFLVVLIAKGPPSRALATVEPPDVPAIAAPVIESAAMPTPPASAGGSPLPSDDLRSAEPVYVLPATVPLPEPVRPQQSAPRTVAPPPAVTEPLDPIAMLDRKAVNTAVTVRLVGHTLGMAYMFTNPGAPVMSLDAFRSLFKMPLTAEVVSPRELRVTTGRGSFVTSDFIELDGRIWLVLKSEVVAHLGYKVTAYGGGFLDFEPNF